MIQKEKKEKEAYNPYEHREVAHPTTFSETMFHLLKGSLGTGILAMPMAFKNSGFIVGTLGTVAIGAVCCYCIHILIDAQHELCVRKKEPRMSYPNIAINAFMEGPPIFQKMGKFMGIVVNIFLLFFQLGACCVYVVFVSSNIKSVADSYMENPIDIRIYMLMILVPLILINFVRNLKLLAPFSTVANFITLVTFAIIWYYIFRDSLTFEKTQAWGPIDGYPIFFGIVLFALEAIGIMLPLENEMKEPQRFASPFGILNIGFVIITALYVSMGFFGYLKYGDEILGSITLNLPANETLSQAVKLLLAFAIYVTHGLACFVAIDIIWRDYVVDRLKPNQSKLFMEFLVRTGVVVLTFLLAVLIPKLGLFISLVGAFCLSTLGLALPAIIQILIYYKERTGFQKFWLFFSNIIIILIGVIGLIIGTTIAMIDIIESFDE